MLNLDNKSIIQSRDIIRLNEAYHDWIEKKVSRKKEIDDNDVIVNSKIQEVYIVQDYLRILQDQDELKKKKVYRLVRLLESSFNPVASTMLQNIEQGRKILFEQAYIALFSGIMIDEEPSTFDEAWNHEDSKARGKW
jgi:adenylosuccinate synthase